MMVWIVIQKQFAREAINNNHQWFTVVCNSERINWTNKTSQRGLAKQEVDKYKLDNEKETKKAKL